MLTPLSVQLAWLEDWISQAEKSLRSKPPGILVAQSGYSTPQYYVKKEHSDAHGQYISKKEISYISALAQKDYDLRFLKAAKAQAHLLLRLQKYGAERSAYPLFQALANVYSSLPASRRSLVTPYVLPDDLFVKEWLGQPRPKSRFSPDDPMIFTERGERVRSKSEKMIADKLHLLHIPYIYEKPARIAIAGPVDTDFTLLDLKERQDIRMEHFGMMERLKYLKRALNKNEGYQLSGYTLGDRFLCTFESDSHVLNMQHFEAMLHQRLDLSLYEDLRF